MHVIFCYIICYFHQFDPPTVATINVILWIQDPFMMATIQVANVVCQLRPCSMFLLRTEQNFGKKHNSSAELGY